MRRALHIALVIMVGAWGYVPQMAFAVSPNEIEAATNEVRALVGTAPGEALPKLSGLHRRAEGIDDRRERVLAIATIARLQAEAFLRLNQPERAEPLLATMIAKVRSVAPTSRQLADLLLSRGGMRVDRAMVAEALSDFHEAFALYQRMGDTRAQASTLLSISYLYAEAKDYDSVIKYARQARQIYRGGDPLILLSIYNNRALSFLELGRYAEAEGQFALAFNVAQGMKSPMLEAQVLRNLARAQLLAKKPAAASLTLRHAIALAPRDNQAEARAGDAIAAQIAFEQGRLDDAESLIARSFAGVDLATSQLSSREAHESAYRIYAARHDEAKALAHHVALKRLDDEATKLATTASTALMGARFDFANQELKIANLERDEARRSVAFERARAESQRLLFLGGAGAVSAIIVLLLVGLFAIRRSRDQVRAVAADLRVSNDALGKALAAKTEFLATTSHEIRTPLNGILGMTQVILADHGLEPTLRDRLQLVHSAGTTMRTLVDDILDVAKMETGNLEIERIAFDACATLREAAALWEDQARARGIALRVDLSGCPVAMMGDPARVRQIAFNLLSNALKFTRDGSITLRADGSADRFVLAVSDTGVGIPADKLETIFESFRQADAGTTRQFGGTGLGLSICRNLAHAMDGRITVASVPGCGSTFTVELPFEVPIPDKRDTAASGKRALLIVERNPIARAMLRTLFSPQVAVELVATTDDALAWIAANDPLAILADDGTVAAADGRRIAAQAGSAPLFLLCRDAGTARQRGSDAWWTLSRPIAGRDLVAAVLDESVSSKSDTLASEAA